MPTTPSPSTSPRGFRRVAPAFALFFLSPFVAEFLLGDFSITALPAILLVGPMYGGGALAVREIARRLGRGWPTLILLALAYGVLEEGIVIQTLFNPNYLGLHLLQQAYIPALGIGGWWTTFVLALHTVWSISVPIALVEGMFAERRTTPWLGNLGLGVSLLLLLAGGWLIRFFTTKQDPFTASAAQLASAAAILLLVVLLALRCRPSSARRPGVAPAPWLVGAVAFVLGLAFMAVTKFVHDWIAVTADLTIELAGTALLLAWSRRATWTPIHLLAAAGGALVTYACYGFYQEPVLGAKGLVNRIGNGVFAAVALTVLVLAIRQQRKLLAASSGPAAV
jgi:hypothetical protein